MKIKKGFMLREVDGNVIVVAIGKASLTFNGMISMNATGKFLWEKLENDCTESELISSLMTTYEVEETVAKADVRGFIEKLEKGGILE